MTPEKESHNKMLHQDKKKAGRDKKVFEEITRPIAHL